MQTSRKYIDLALIIGVTAFVLWFAWIGWLDSDDKNHFVGALGWLNQFPYVGTTHAALRHTIAFPVGMSLRLFGVSEFSLIIPNLLEYFGIIVVTWLAVRRSLGERTAFWSCMLIATLPLFPIFASVIFTETTELFYLISSFWLFHASVSSPRRVPLLFFAGLMAGFGWLTRETTAALLLFYGFLFLLGFGIPRRYYWVMAGGFLLVAGGEALIMWALTDNPLHRYDVVLSKQGNIPYKGAIAGDVFNRIGNFSVNPVLDPLLVLFLNHEFSLLFYLSIPAGIWCWTTKEPAAQARGTLRLLTGWAIVWFLFVSIMLTNLHPRYYAVCAYAAAILVAAWIEYFVGQRSKRLSRVLLAVLIVANLTALYIDNRNPMFGERELIEFSRSSDEDVYTDAVTHRRALFFLENAGLEKRVRNSLPPPGALFFFNPNRAMELSEKGLDIRDYRPSDNAVILRESAEPRKLPGIVMERLGLEKMVPPSIYRRLNRPNLPVLLYRKNST